MKPQYCIPLLSNMKQLKSKETLKVTGNPIQLELKTFLLSLHTLCYNNLKNKIKTKHFHECVAVLKNKINKKQKLFRKVCILQKCSYFEYNSTLILILQCFPQFKTTG